MSLNLSSTYVLEFHGKRHNLAMLLEVAKSAPVITVKREELLNPDIPAEGVTIKPTLEVLNDNGIIFYKHEGKYIVLSGKNRLAQAAAEDHFKGEFIGRLISHPALKKTRLEDTASPYQAAPRTPFYSDEFANRPRFAHPREMNIPRYK